jgi:mRNA export factor
MVFGAPAPASFGASTSSATATGSSSNNACAPGDHCVAQAGNDGISSLNWSPTSNHMISTNWDGGVRCWNVEESGQQIRATPVAQGECNNMYSMLSLLLCCFAPTLQ